jgi:DNA-directed RNA polymerase beta' subunit
VLFFRSGIIQQLLTEFNFYEIKKMDKQNRILLYQLNKQIFKLKRNSTVQQKKELKEAYKKRDLLSRTKLIRKLFIKESAPQSTIPTLPVPPDLRPVKWVVKLLSDLNRLYQRVIYRNDRLKFLSSNKSFL